MCSSDLLADGESLIVFPEGTRSQPGKPVVLQRGFAHLATQTGAPILPVTIRCTPPTLTKGEPWWRIPERPPVFTVTVGHPVAIETFSSNVNRGLAARRVTKYFTAYYQSEEA